MESISWQKLDTREPYYFFIPKTYKNIEEFNQGFALNKLFSVNVTGIVTMGDDFAISDTKTEMKDRLLWLKNNDVNEAAFRQKYNVGKNYPSWVIGNAKKINFDEEKITKITYRPFDDRYTYFDNDVIWRWREEVMNYMLKKDNIGLVACRQCISAEWSHVFITNILADDSYVSNKSKERGYLMPLYRYEAVMGDVEQKVPNFDPAIYAKIKDAVPDATPESLFDYIYAVLHAPAYRTRYAEFLKSDFPRIPYPSGPATFYALAEKGASIRELHLLESPLLDDTGVTYPVSGDNKVDKPDFKNGKVWINKDQYFDGVSQTAWDFYIGGYQPAQKWLKDRKYRPLTMDDIQHYRKIIKALHETDRLMREIDQINFLPEEN